MRIHVVTGNCRPDKHLAWSLADHSQKSSECSGTTSGTPPMPLTLGTTIIKHIEIKILAYFYKRIPKNTDVESDTYAFTVKEIEELILLCHVTNYVIVRVKLLHRRRKLASCSY